MRRSLKNAQSGHHASGLKLVPAIGSTSRWPQHSGPSSGGRRQRHDLNFVTAADGGADSTGWGGPAGGSERRWWKRIRHHRFSFYANADGLFQQSPARAVRSGATSVIARPDLVRAARAADAVHVARRANPGPRS